MSKQINVDEDKIQNTQIVVTVKTLWTVVGVIVLGISTLFGVMQSNLSSAESNFSKQLESIKSTQKETTLEVKRLVEKLEEKKVDPLDDEVTRIDKEVFLLMNRTNSRHSDYTHTSGPSESRMDTSFHPSSNSPNSSPE